MGFNFGNLIVKNEIFSELCLIEKKKLKLLNLMGYLKSIVEKY